MVDPIDVGIVARQCVVSEVINSGEFSQTRLRLEKYSHRVTLFLLQVIILFFFSSVLVVGLVLSENKHTNESILY
jgi:hypothetical protein